MSKILIIGTEKVGKTTLLSALAHKYSVRKPNDYFIDAKTIETAVFKNYWSIIAEKHEWLPPTLPGSGTHLKWKLHLRDDPARSVDMTCIDLAGENYQRIFVGDENPEDLLMSADAIVILVNLSSLLDECNEIKKTENEWVIKNCLDKLPNGIPACIVLSQIDRYKSYFTNDIDEGKLIEKFLPQTYGAYDKYISTDSLPIYCVSAVNKTRAIEDLDGFYIEKPAEGFESDGLEKIDGLDCYSFKMC